MWCSNSSRGSPSSRPVGSWPPSQAKEETGMAKQSRSLTGTVVAITGGARGIGRATAAQLVEAGARVAIGDLDRSLAERTASELGLSVSAYELDVTDRGSFERFIDAAESDLGPVDVL